MLKLDAVTLQKGDFRLQADLQIAAGAQVAVIGPSGAGKSTLLEAIAGFLPARDGRILWRGQDITALPPGQRPVAMLFQDGNLFPHLTLRQNVGLGIDANRRLSAAQAEAVTAALARVGLAGMEERRPADLSGGQQSRAALARVLVQGRDLLLLDEPFAALGPALKAEMLDLVAEIVTEKGATLLMVSHDPQDARRIATEVVLVADGHVYPPSPTAEILDNPPPALRAYLGAPTGS
ncbi:ATP-binding cassette domain-containing protein [Phaeobacter sp. B1627]|uniref:thiamine ABC transporter ATP-binding protein n=1 Tax=Phaeobacter sp. B1627 TaxID=2583809 RepID=UPI00111A96D5|nr:ATP-binding cassette domain-containing protein [Phaeobacter sp. B1627]TNJ45100.1 ATP-binding cassette domain-containing protein [Phaeobacter sp. B1627]